jgi:hypothetical protein
MNMKNLKNILRILLTSASLLGFLGGWATLAHSRKPIQSVANQPQALEPLAPLAPLPAIGSLPANTNSNTGNGLLNIFTPSTAPSVRTRSRPMFTTSGS